jgi:hypothetical protein
MVMIRYVFSVIYSTTVKQGGAGVCELEKRERERGERERDSHSCTP